MPSMYDTLMELPLFKGIGAEQLSLMLEKTSMEFVNYEDGEIIYRADQKVKTVNFILRGKVKQIFKLNHFPVCVEEIIGEGSLLGAIHLFGLDTTFTGECIAMGKVSLLRIEKSQYMRVLHSDKIYLLNFVNYLSAAAQKAQDYFIKNKEDLIRRTLEGLAYSIASRGSEAIMISGHDEDLANYCGVSLPAFLDWRRNELLHNRIVSNQKGIFIKSPHIK